MRVSPLLLAVALCGAASATQAAPCYVVYDRNDAVVYRDYAPPFDLSKANAPERAMMRQNGQHLIVAEFDKCNPVGYISPTTGGTTATVDEIVSGLQPAIGTSMMGTPSSGSGSSSYSGAPGNGGAGAPAPSAGGGSPVPRTVSGASGVMHGRTY